MGGLVFLYNLRMVNLYSILRIDKSIEKWITHLRYFDTGFKDVFDKATLETIRFDCVHLAIQCICRKIEDLGWIEPNKITTFYTEISRMKPCSVAPTNLNRSPSMWELVGGDERFRCAFQRVLNDPQDDDHWLSLKKAIDNLLYESGKEPWK